MRAIRPVSGSRPRTAGSTEDRVNRVIGRDATRERQPLGAPRPREPIPAAVGVADWGDTLAIGGS